MLADFSLPKMSKLSRFYDIEGKPEHPRRNLQNSNRYVVSNRLVVKKATTWKRSQKNLARSSTWFCVPALDVTKPLSNV